MVDALVGVGVAAGLGAAAVVGRDRWRRARALRRLGTLDPARDRAAEAAPPEREVPRSLLRDRASWPWICAALLGPALLAAGLPVVFAVAVAFAAGALGAVAESSRRSGFALRLEGQLADSVDLMIGALRAGSGMVDALERASRSSREPLGPVLAETAARLRLGERPQEVLRDLALRVPLEAFQLFAFALSVNWEAGGSLAPTLATVGRSVRDRVELSRRIRSQSAPTLASIASLLLATYGIAWLTWARDPSNVERFLATPSGSAMVAATIALQAAGLLWMWKWSQVRF